MAPHHDRTEPVGLTEIARRLKVADQTARQWAHRGVLPPPTWPKADAGRNLWQWGTVEQWAILTGRLPGVPAVLSCGHSRRVAPGVELPDVATCPRCDAEREITSISADDEG